METELQFGETGCNWRACEKDAMEMEVVVVVSVAFQFIKKHYAIFKYGKMQEMLHGFATFTSMSWPCMNKTLQWRTRFFIPERSLSQQTSQRQTNLASGFQSRMDSGWKK